MVETFTPAVCGSRARQRLAIGLFAWGALAASAALGTTLAYVGSFIGRQPALIGAAALAFLALLRESGAVRIPLPQARKQVPERWRHELPLPLWSSGYGAGLGLGFLTFQPVATFWVACGAALALGQPLVAAACFALYGAGRAFMAIWPRRREPDGAVAVERLVAGTSVMARMNATVLLLVVVLLAVAPAAGAAVTKMGSGFDPSVSGKTIARARMSGGTVQVVVVPPAPDPAVSISPADAPAVDEDRLAYANSRGIKVINWRTNTVDASIDGPVSEPALDWPLLAFIRRDGSLERLILADLTDPAHPQERSVASVSERDDLGRPSLRRGRLAWVRGRHRQSALFVLDLATLTRHTVRSTTMWMESNPAITSTRIVWVEARQSGSYLRMRRFGHRRVNTLAHVSGRRTFLWTTALSGRTAYVTRLTPVTGDSTLLRVTF